MPDEHDSRPVSESAPPAIAAGATPPKLVMRWRDLDLFAGRSAPPPPRQVTAIEIENFKGTGQPVRIELRPITLLFGRNSAGKSTILHALAYAHEVLNNRNFDAGKTEPGGAQIDLGGFRKLVHRHDLERTVRFRFELRFEQRIKGTALSKNIAVEIPEPEADHPVINDSIYSPLMDSGWVMFTVAWNKARERPEVASYEVGANGSLFGRLQNDGNGVVLKVNSAHPLLHAEAGPPDPFARGGRPDEQVLHTVHCAGLTSPLPNWDEDLVLKLDTEGKDRALVANVFPHAELEYSFDEKDFVSFVASALVGSGSALRDELADFRYIGPVRRLRPPDVEPGSRTRGNWSDGSEAWNLLAHGESDPIRMGGRKDLLDEANDWLARDDRLAAGYKLRRRSTIELPADKNPVRSIHAREKHAAAEHRTSGSWARELAKIIAALTKADPDEIETRIKSDRDEDNELTLLDFARERYRDLRSVERLEAGEDTAALEELVRAIATAPVRRTLQLLTVGSELPVRTADIGVGISQLVPVVVAVLDQRRPQLTAIEQPELHVHPRIQVELGDLFAQRIDQSRALLEKYSESMKPEFARTKRLRKLGVLLIETHSEHLLLRLMRRMRQTNDGTLPDGAPALHPEDVGVFLVEADGAQTIVREMPLNERGELVKAWPGGFFEEDLQEIF